MRSERRRELKHNALADNLRRLPSFLNKYGPYLATAVIIAVGVAWVLINRHQAAQQQILAAQGDLNSADDKLHHLQDDGLETSGLDAHDLIENRRSLYAAGLQKAQDAFANAPTDQPAIRASALVLEGDLNFAMANLPALPGAASEPSLQPDQPINTLLANAFGAYQQVLRDYPSDVYATTAAHFGLAAIAEETAARQGPESSQAEWTTAFQEYQAITASNAPQALRNVADSRQKLLITLSQPILIDLPPLIPTTLPSTMPTTMPFTFPLTIPTTMRSPTFPSTVPSAIPTTIPSATPATLPATLPSTVPEASDQTVTGNCGYSGSTTIDSGAVLQSGSGAATQPVTDDSAGHITITTNPSAALSTGEVTVEVAPTTTTLKDPSFQAKIFAGQNSDVHELRWYKPYNPQDASTRPTTLPTTRP